MAILSSENIISASSVVKVFKNGELEIRILDNIDLAVKAGEMLAITGRSGSGKSTLLHILGGLDHPSFGTVEIDEINIHRTSERMRAKMRNKFLGFVYQFHHLLPEFTALENVSMPLLIGGGNLDEIRERSASMLLEVGLAGREQHQVGELSGGERQRLAIARALITNPRCILADEPTGNLDGKTAGQIYDLLFKLREDLNMAFVIVTHDISIARRMTRSLLLEHGKLNEYF